MDSHFELRLKNIENTKYHTPTIEVLDTFDTVLLAMREMCGASFNATAADAVRLTELILARTPE